VVWLSTQLVWQLTSGCGVSSLDLAVCSGDRYTDVAFSVCVCVCVILSHLLLWWKASHIHFTVLAVSVASIPLQITQIDIAKSIGHSIVDHANALLHGMSTGIPDRMQLTPNSLAMTVSHSASVTELRRQLHWLPVHWQSVIIYKTRSTGAQAYLSQLIRDCQPAHTHIMIIG